MFSCDRAQAVYLWDQCPRNEIEKASRMYTEVGLSELELMTGGGSEGMSLLTNYASGAPCELSSGMDYCTRRYDLHSGSLPFSSAV